MKICPKLCECSLCDNIKPGNTSRSGSVIGVSEEEDQPLNKAKPSRAIRNLIQKQDCDSDSGISVSSCTKALKIDVDVNVNPSSSSPKENEDYTTMIQEALLALAEIHKGAEDQQKGVSQMNVLLYILKHYKSGDDIATVNTKVKNGLKFLSRMGVIDKLSVDGGEPIQDESDVEDETTETEVKTEEEVVKKEKKAESEKKKKSDEVQTSTPPKKKKVLTDKLNVEDKKKKQIKDTSADKKEHKSRPKKLTPALAALCGGSRKMSRHDVIKSVWQYVKANSLQDPSQKSFILCDDKLKGITKKKRIPQTELLVYITKHLSDFEIKKELKS